MDLESMMGCAKKEDEIELGWSSTVELTSSGSSITDDSADTSLGKKEAKRRRKSKRGGKNNVVKDEEEEAMLRRRRIFLGLLSFVPFLFASVALVAVMSSASNNGEDHASLAANTNAAMVASLQSDVPTLAPSTPAPSKEVVTKTGQPSSPQPLPAVASSPDAEAEAEAEKDGESHNDIGVVGLRPTKSPFQSPTASPSKSPSTAPQPATCVAAGVSCPENKKDCCSGKCQRDKDTDEKVCEVGNSQNKFDPKKMTEHTNSNDACVASGLTCPNGNNNGSLCCSGSCISGGKTKTCM